MTQIVTARNSGARDAPDAAVCVPVRDEATLLPHLLDALAAQSWDGSFALCVLLDGCSDASAAILRERAPGLPFAVVLEASPAGPPNAGRARRAAMAIGLRLIADDAMLVSSDADSVPDATWLAANAAALKCADVAAGRVLRAGDPASPMQDRIEAYYDSLFALRRAVDPVAWEAPRTHHFTSGASLALRAGSYRALGGFEPLPSAEDARLVDAAHRAGLRVRRDAAIRVTTSARRDGRARGGLADHLRALDSGAGAATMAHPADAVWRYERQAAARRAWPDLPAQRERLATLLGCSGGAIDAAATGAKNAEAFAMQVVPAIPGGERIVALDAAEVALARLWLARRTLAA